MRVSAGPGRAINFEQKIRLARENATPCDHVSVLSQEQRFQHLTWFKIPNVVRAHPMEEAKAIIAGEAHDKLLLGDPKTRAAAQRRVFRVCRGCGRRHLTSR